MYSYKTDNNKINKRCKGNKKCVIEQALEHINYKNCLNNHKELTKKQKFKYLDLRNIKYILLKLKSLRSHTTAI